MVLNGLCVNDSQFYLSYMPLLGLPWLLSCKDSTCSAGDTGLILGVGMAAHSRILAWGIPRTGAWWATVQRLVRVGHDQ